MPDLSTVREIVAMLESDIAWHEENHNPGDAVQEAFIRGLMQARNNVRQLFPSDGALFVCKERECCLDTEKETECN
jgi:hypothetical protein